jgi:glycosyltransferase involved in cell wall biosynthesis
MIAVLRPQKDPLTLVRAAGILRDAGRLPFCVVIVGNGALREEVLAEIERLALGNDVTLLPFAGDVQAYLRAFDLFALPSLWESLPISIIEAMACGLPVVGTTVSGVPEAVADGVTGRLVPPGSPQAMADAIAGLMADPGALLRAGEAGRAAYERRFRMAPMLQNVADLYDRLTS